LTLLPFGADKFKMILAVPFGFMRHITPLTLASFGLSFGSNGPAAMPCCTHSAMASVTSAPQSYALRALPQTVASLAAPTQPMFAPFSRSLHTVSNLSLSVHPMALAHDLSRVADTGDVPAWLWFTGKEFQNSAPAVDL
jgi:hypothetical protein